MESVKQYIMQNWGKCIRYEPDDRGTLIGLPHRYVVPTCEGVFQEMYYWDTYFTCKGLMLSGHIDLAKCCADNMAYMIEKYGFMPNGTRTYYLTRSQPPFFCMLVDSVFKMTGDVQWLKDMYFYIKKEYNFWQNCRMTPIGLNRYGTSVCSEESGKERYKVISERIKREIDISEYDSYADFGMNATAECESGWDFNPRWSLHTMDYASADLNSNLYLYETLMQNFSAVIGADEEEVWIKRAELRRELMNKYLWNGEVFADYNYVKDEFSFVFSAASFYPLWAGLASKEQAQSTLTKLCEIEFDHGVVPCAKSSAEGNYQWDYPNAWAPLQYIVIKAMENCGFTKEAIRIAKKYKNTVDRVFEETGKLWEKYNAVTGGTDVYNEYEMPEMLGWTAGVYLYICKFLEKSGEV